jgi:protein-S-isoprenylcysteine O-methyltransferase Ste14
MSLQLTAAVGFAIGFYSITIDAVTRARRLTGRSPLIILRSGTTEEKTSVALLQVFPAACVASAVFPDFALFRPLLDVPVLRVVGAVALAAGLWLHFAALRALGAAFQVGVDPSQTPGIVTAGPYRYVRHPIYAAFLAYFVGAWLLLPTALFSISMPLAIVRVILQARYEEAALAAAFGAAYTDYMRSTTRFVPGVF